MHKLPPAAALLGLLALVACSGADHAGETSEPAGAVSAGISGSSCSDLMLGVACDPDGDLGALSECEGVCWFSQNGQPACLTLAQAGMTQAQMDGRVCGAGNGTLCSSQCSAGACVPGIPVGAACRVNESANTCSGGCILGPTGNGLCSAGLKLPGAAKCTSYKRIGCVMLMCDPKDVWQACTNVNLPPSTACEDANQCTIGDACDGEGTCLSGSPKACDDGNVCTKDACDSASGACEHAATTCDDANPCTIDWCNPTSGCVHATNNCDDANACTSDSCNPSTGCFHVSIECNDKNACTSDSCNPATGQCTFLPTDCNDGNACTIDSCNSTTGQCSNVAIECNDANACTTDVCNPATGQCSFSALDCGDQNACTVDTCDSATGLCSNTKISCDDADACTIDLCEPASGCGHIAQNCEDADPCTTDGCNPASGCTHAQIPGCVWDGGAGGASAGAAGESPGAAGESAGAAGGGLAGSGAAAAGAAGGGPSAQGGSSGVAGSNATEIVVEDSGCGCRAPSRGQPGAGSLWLAALIAFELTRRRCAATKS